MMPRLQYAFLMVCIALVCFTFSCTETRKEKTVLHILGTVHEPTENVNADSIYKRLETFKPDLILIELDSSFFHDDFSFNTTFEGNEIIACKKYIEHHPAVRIRPIEFEGRESYREKIGIDSEISGAFGNTLQQLMESNALATTDQSIITELIRVDQIITDIKTKTLDVMNTPETDAYVSNWHQLKYDGLLKIANTYPIFTEQMMMDTKGDSISIKDNFALFAAFEGYQRNDAMVQNTLRHIKENEGKRIIALVGFAHRAYLLKAIKIAEPNLLVQ